MTVRAGSASSDSAWEAGSRSCWWRTTGSPSLARIAAVSPRASIRFSTARARSLAATAPRTRRYGGVAAELERALTAADVPHDVKEYPDAGHSFLNDHDPRELNALVVLLARLSNSQYHEPSAAGARRRILGFFDEHLRAPTP